MATISRTAYTAGTPAVAAEVNANENTIVNVINGNLDNDNIKANAGIVDSKLAQITTAGKVSTAALIGTITNEVSTTNVQSTNISIATLTATNISGLTTPLSVAQGGTGTTGAWADYTPTITADGDAFDIGNGTKTGRWVQMGKVVYF